MRRHHKRGTARFGCLRRFCLSTHSESFGVIRWPECDCVCAGVGLSGGRGRLLTHVHRASACTLNAVGLLPVSGRGDARVAPPCPTTLCVWRRLPYLTFADYIPRTNGGFDPCRAPTMSHEVYGASLVATIASHAQGTWIVRIRRAQSLESGLHSTEAWRPATCSCRPEGVR